MLYLASNSPRRKHLLALGGWGFRVYACDVDESVLPGEMPGEYVLRLAESKARSAAARLVDQALANEWCSAVVVAADTAVVDPYPVTGAGRGNTILGKPADPADARKCCCVCVAATTKVYTGLAVLRLTEGAMRCKMVSTEVLMREYSDAEIDRYIADGDPLDKAGAYGIQHADFHPVQSLRGCYPNVMGLPVCRLAELLVEVGLPAPTGVLETCNPSASVPCRVYQQATVT